MSEDRDRDLSRRLFMREAAIGGTAAAVAASGTAAAQQEGDGGQDGEGGGAGGDGGGGGEGGDGGGEGESGDGGGEGGGEGEGEQGGGGGNQVPAWSGFVQDANTFDRTEDARGQSEVTVQVGTGDGFAFSPAAIWIDPGATVIWEWTGEGGGHNVSSTGDLDFESDVTSEAGFTFEYTFEEAGLFEYECVPHTAQGMHGGVAVGDEIPTTEPPSEGGAGGSESGGVQLPGAAKAVAVAITVALSSTLGLTYVFMKYGGDYEGDRIE